jgi:DNA gyrase subunit A
MQRPNLDNVDPAIVAYIEFLESKLQAYTSRKNIIQAEEAEARLSEPALPAEPPTTINIVTVSQESIAKRTARHLYPRQHRGGMGIYDLDVPSPDYPAFVSGLDESENALIFTNQAKVYRLPASRIQEGEVRSKGGPLFDRDRIAMESSEHAVTILPERSSGYVAMVSAQGKVRCLRHHLFGEHMRPGTVFFNVKETGPLVAACWSEGDHDLFVLTEKGIAIRFNEKLLNPQGDWGIKLAAGDRVVAITPVYQDSLVFMVGADGKGTIREMEGFAANKSVGGSGKIALKNEHVVSAVTVTPNDDLFLITRLGKIIRFKADEVPSTDAVVQGVICVNMRNDEVVSATVSGLKY